LDDGGSRCRWPFRRWDRTAFSRAERLAGGAERSHGGNIVTENRADRDARTRTGLGDVGPPEDAWRWRVIAFPASYREAWHAIRTLGRVQRVEWPDGPIRGARPSAGKRRTCISGRQLERGSRVLKSTQRGALRVDAQTVCSDASASRWEAYRRLSHVPKRQAQWI